MSGGSWDYAYRNVGELADRLLVEDDVKRRALGRRLKLIAEALHAIEWVDSNDFAPGDEIKHIDLALGDSPENEALSYLFVEANKMILECKNLLDKRAR